MSGLFGGAKTPEPVTPIDHEAIAAAGDEERKRRRAARGRASTMMTGGQLSPASVGAQMLRSS